MSARLFHLTLPGAWPLATDFSPPSLGREGFVHLSFAHQLDGTLREHFPEVAELVLVEVCAQATADALRLEPSRGGEDFPHLYRPLRASDALRRWRLRRGPDGSIGLPAELGDPGAPPRNA